MLSSSSNSSHANVSTKIITCVAPTRCVAYHTHTQLTSSHIHIYVQLRQHNTHLSSSVVKQRGVRLFGTKLLAHKQLHQRHKLRRVALGLVVVRKKQQLEQQRLFGHRLRCCRSTQRQCHAARLQRRRCTLVVVVVVVEVGFGKRYLRVSVW